MANAQATTGGGQVTQGSKVGQFWKDECGATDADLKEVGGKYEGNYSNDDYFKFMFDKTNCDFYPLRTEYSGGSALEDPQQILLSKKDADELNKSYGVDYFKENDLVLSQKSSIHTQHNFFIIDDNPNFSQEYSVKKIIPGESDFYSGRMGGSGKETLITDKNRSYSILSMQGKMHFVIVHDKNLIESKERYDYLVSHKDTDPAVNKYSGLTGLSMKDDFIKKIGEVTNLPNLTESTENKKQKVFMDEINFSQVVNGGNPLQLESITQWWIIVA